jgi:hypothetical protein
MSESDRAKKQEFLRTEILEAGYAQEDFVLYCSSLKGDDIDLWAFEELIKAVEDFKSQDTNRPVTYSGVERLEEGCEFTITGRVANVTQLSGASELVCRVTE